MADVFVEVEVRYPAKAQPDTLEAEVLARGAKPIMMRLANSRVRSIVVRPLVETPPTGKVAPEQAFVGFAAEDFPFFDLETGTYILGPLPQAQLHALNDAAVSVEIELRHAEIFDLILQEWMSSDTTRTLANRHDDDPLLASILAAKHRTSTKRRVPFDLRERDAKLTVPGRFRRTSADDGEKGILVLDLDTSAGLEVRRLFAAADWSAIHDHEAKPSDPAALPLGLEIPTQVVRYFLAAHAPLSRGATLLAKIVNRNAGHASAREIVVGTRADIDRCLIAANHWGEARESSQSTDAVERYQSRMSDFFGMLYEQRSLASPVNLVRGMLGLGHGISRYAALHEKYEVTLWLQVGVGHCGEHARVAYRCLQAIRDVAPSKAIQRVLLSGNANIDHAFVLVNVEISEVFHTRVLNPHSSTYGTVAGLTIFDLADTLSRAQNADALVLDAYLQYERFEGRADELLRSLKNKKNAKLETTYIQFVESTPAPKRPPTDLLAWTDAELKARFKNI